MKTATTRKPRSKQTPAEMRTEYDFSGGVQGKYADQYRQGVNVVLLEPKLVEAFPDSKSVNDALRGALAWGRGVLDVGTSFFSAVPFPLFHLFHISRNRSCRSCGTICPSSLAPSVRLGLTDL
jgi:hypothetical protein